MKKVIISTFILFLFSQIVYSQYNRFNRQNRNHFTNKKNYYNLGKHFYSEIHYLPFKKDSVKAIILFRFSYNLLSFEKYKKINSKNELFFAIPIVEAEFEDNEGIIRKRIVWQDTIFTSDFVNTISKTDYIKGKLIATVSSKNYKVNIKISDKNNHNIKKIVFKDTIPHNFLSNNVISNPIFTYAKDINSQIFYPYILNNNISFSSKNSVILVPVSYSDEFEKYYYSCFFTKSEEKEGLKWQSDFNISGYLVPQKESTININDKLELSISPFRIKSSYKIGVLVIPMQIEKIVPGNYKLKITRNNSVDTLNYRFKVVWENRPLILQKPKMAIESMYYILKDEEYEKMLDADRDKYSEEILNYWNKNDPTKSTPYNEAMAEYFNRVDYAIFNFQTFNKKNGMKTDRGKIYILYGEPSEISKDFKEHKTYEIWIYTNLKKKFFFLKGEDDKYKLVDIVDKQ